MIHFVFNSGVAGHTPFGLVIEAGTKRMTDPEGSFYGVIIYFLTECLVIGICQHGKEE